MGINLVLAIPPSYTVMDGPHALIQQEALNAIYSKKAYWR
jgi:hypothetical protein